MIIAIIANIFIGTILALVGVYLLIYRKVAIYSNDGNKKHFNKGVSLIIAVRNELENLKQNLPLQHNFLWIQSSIFEVQKTSTIF